MNVKIGAEAAQFPKKEYTVHINGIAVAVYPGIPCSSALLYSSRLQFTKPAMVRFV
jgi:hypothetical protein